MTGRDFNLMLKISDHYFEFDHLQHRADCRLAGTGMWEVSWMRRPGYLVRGMDDEGSLLVMRMLCRQCGAVHLVGADHDGYQVATVDQIGYGAKPERAAGLWLHPGPPWEHFEDRGPKVFYATGSPQPPAEPDDVIGVIEWTPGKRGGTVWAAGYRLREGEYGLCVERNAGEDRFRSKTAAARWVADQHAQAQAAATVKASA